VVVLYQELDDIRKIKSKTAKMEMILLFIEEYSGWLQHLKSVGLSWGANGEEMGANKEAVKTRKHIDCLKSELLAISG
jgi:hypothetical protein